MAAVSKLIMDTDKAKEIIGKEQETFWLWGRQVSDTELLRKRERLFSGLTMGFAIACMPVAIFGGVFHLGGIGQLLLVIGLVVAARQCSTRANNCRDARYFLELSHDRGTPASNT